MLTIHHVHDGTAQRVDRTVLDEGFNGPGFLWIDLQEPDEHEVTVLHHPSVALDPMVIEDMTDDRHLPKLDVLGDQIAITVHGIAIQASTVEIDTLELDIAIKTQLLVTYHAEPLDSIVHIIQRLERKAAGHLSRPTELVHLMLDVMNDVFVPFLDLIEERLAWVEEDILTDPSEQTRREIYALQRDVIALRRTVVPQAEVIHRLSRERVELLTEDDRALFRDIYDHLFRMTELSESYRQLLDSAMANYRSALDDNLNGMLNTLTLISSTLLPISVLASIYGMNFAYIPELDYRYSYFILLGVFGVIITGMLAWFRHKGWLGRRGHRERQRRRATQILEIPVLGQALKVPAYGARAVVLTGRTVVRIPRRLAHRRSPAGNQRA